MDASHCVCSITRGLTQSNSSLPIQPAAILVNLMRNNIADLANCYRIDNGKKFRLKDCATDQTGGFTKEFAAGILEESVATLSALQEKLFAQSEWSVLLIFQAMDAAGKDATIKHVLTGVNPQGCHVSAFKAPSAEELNHDFLWRASRCLPERGQIGVFNRSYYEEALVVRVHPDYLKNQKLPEKCLTKRIWDERFESINDFERHITRNGTVVLKFFLHLSPGEQKKRLRERLDEKERNYKFKIGDLTERKLWSRYMDAYEDALQHTSTKHASWHVVPADHKWFSRLVVSAVVIDALQNLKLHFPPLDAEAKKNLATARAELGTTKK